jgi:hypothetical protein
MVLARARCPAGERQMATMTMVAIRWFDGDEIYHSDTVRLAEFVEDNPEDVEEAEIAALMRGETLTFGGGAAPLVRVSLVA